jgi:hypothetical protein
MMSQVGHQAILYNCHVILMGSYNNKHIDISSFFTNHVQTLKLVGEFLNDHELQNNTQYYKKISDMHY